MIKSINCKFPHQNLTEIYYNIGRAFPFTAQRFPDGRVSDWYRNQYVEVVRVVPQGKYGKYGKVLGFYYRNGEGADSCTDNFEQCWCTKNETEPQPITCCGCGSWSLIDILGERITDTIKVLVLDDILEFGKYKSKSLKDVITNDWQYVKWTISESQHLYIDVDKVLEYHMENRLTLAPDDVMNFGKYKGKSISEVYKIDPQYLIWLSQNNDSFNLDGEKV